MKGITKITIILLLMGTILSCTTLQAGQATPIVKTDVPSPTPTIPATATPLPPPTETPIPQNILDAQAFAGPILAALPDIPPLLRDDFSYNRGWYIEPHAGNAPIRDGAFHVDPDNCFSIPPSGGSWRRDFAMQVDIAPEASVGMGFFFRLYEGEYYSTAVVNLADGTWQIDLGCPGCQDQDGRLNIPLSDHTATLLLIVKGQQGALYINGLPIAYFTDSGEFQEGRLGIICNRGPQNSSETSYGTFDNFILWDLWGRP